MSNKITVDDFHAVGWGYLEEILADILNKEYDLDEAIDDIRGLIGSKYDNRITGGDKP